MKIPVFVYGTLLTGEGNWSWALAPDVGKPALLAGFQMIHLGGFPGIIDSEVECNPIVGEIFYCNKETLRQLDRLEGHPTFYKRRKCTTTDGEVVFTYVYQTRSGWFAESIIESSNWLSLRKGLQSC